MARTLSTVRSQPSAAAFLGTESGKTVVVPGGDFLLTARFERAGPDLVLVGADGRQVVVANWFVTTPALATESGAVIAPDLALKLAGPAAALQTAQAGGTEGGLPPIGVVGKLTGTATVRHADGARADLHQGDKLFQGDVIETGDKSSVGMVLADRSTFALGGKGRMVLDEMVYDPANQDGAHSNLSVVQGTFSFVSGDIAKLGPDAMTVRTPVMSIGIRGTTVAGQAAAEGSRNTVTLLSDSGGHTGEIVISNAGGTMVMSQPFQSIQLASFSAPPPPPVTMSAAQVQATYGDALSARPAPPPPGQSPLDPGNGANGQGQTGQGADQQGAAGDTGAADRAAAADTAPADFMTAQETKDLAEVLTGMDDKTIDEMLDVLMAAIQAYSDQIETEMQAELAEAFQEYAQALAEMIEDEVIAEYFDYQNLETDFDQIVEMTTATDEIVGDGLNANYHFSGDGNNQVTNIGVANANDIDFIDGGGGADQISFDNMQGLLIRLVTDSTIADKGTLSVYTSGLNTTGNPVSVEYTGIEQFLFSAEDVFSDYALGYSVSFGSGGPDSFHDALLLTGMNANSTNYAGAGTSGADTITVSSSDYANAEAIVLFGLGGGDTFHIQMAYSGLSMLLAGGNSEAADNTDDDGDATPNEAEDSDDIPSSNINSFSFESLDSTTNGQSLTASSTADGWGSNNLWGLRAMISGSVGKMGATAEVIDRYACAYANGAEIFREGNLKAMLWDMGALTMTNGDDFVGNYGGDPLGTMQRIDLWGGADTAEFDFSDGKLATLTGGSGDDTIALTSGTINAIFGDDNNDTITIGADASFQSIFGGLGNDTVELKSYVDLSSAQIEGGAGTDELKLAGTYSGVTFGAGVLNFETITLDADGTFDLTLVDGTNQTGLTVNGLAVTGALSIDASAETTSITTLIGGSGADTLKGGDGTGNNWLEGGRGNDNVFGSTQANTDYFVFGDDSASAQTGGTLGRVQELGQDTFNNFDASQDKLVFDQDVFGFSSFTVGDNLFRTGLDTYSGSHSSAVVLIADASDTKVFFTTDIGNFNASDTSNSYQIGTLAGVTNLAGVTATNLQVCDPP